MQYVVSDMASLTSHGRCYIIRVGLKLWRIPKWTYCHGKVCWNVKQHVTGNRSIRKLCWNVKQYVTGNRSIGKCIYRSMWDQISRICFSESFFHLIMIWFQAFHTNVSCFDAAAERAMLPSFDGCVGEVHIPGSLVLFSSFNWVSSLHVFACPY